MCLQGMLFLRRDARSHSFSTFLLFFFFFFQTPIISSPVLPLPSHPARPIQLIFSQSNYESTKKSIYHASESSLLFFCDGGNGGLHTPDILLKPVLVVLCFCLPSVPGRMLSCLCCQGTDTPHLCVCMCLCRHPTCV